MLKSSKPKTKSQIHCLIRDTLGNCTTFLVNSAKNSKDYTKICFKLVVCSVKMNNTRSCSKSTETRDWREPTFGAKYTHKFAHTHTYTPLHSWHVCVCVRFSQLLGLDGGDGLPFLLLLFFDQTCSSHRHTTCIL